MYDGSMDWLGSGLMEQLKRYRELSPFFEVISASDFNINYVQKKFSEGETIFHEGERCAGVPFVIKGCIRISKIGKNGKEMTVYRVNAGETCILTVTSILSNQPYPLTAIVEEEAEAIIIPYLDFKLLMEANSNLQEYIYKTISQRFLEVIKIIDEVVFQSIDDRLAKFLLRYSQNEGDLIETTHDKIAAEIGTAREVVSRLLKEMERKGWIKLARGKVYVARRDKLEELLKNKNL